MKSRRTRKQPISLEAENNTTNQDESSGAESDTEKSTQLRLFEANYDDSSDEESVNAALEGYDIASSWKKSVTANKRTIRKSISIDDKMLSFAAHAAGLKLLYSKAINAVYYPNKAKFLSNPASKSSQQLINLMLDATKAALQGVLEKLHEFLSISSPKITDTAIKKIKKNISAAILVKLSDLVDSHVDSFIAELRAIKSGREDNRMAEFVDMMTNLFTTAVLEHVSLTSKKINREETRKSLLTFSQNEIKSLFKKLKFNQLKDTAGKHKALDLLDKYKGPFPFLIARLHSILTVSAAKGCIDNIILHQLDANQNDILRAYLADLKVIAQSKQRHKFKQEMIVFNNYYLLTEDNIRSEMSQHCREHLLEHIEEAMGAFYRPVLAPGNVLASSNPVSFYTNFRLAKRNQERHTANLRSAIFPNNIEVCAWSMAESDLPGVDAVEMKEILNSTFGRRDMVAAIGNYAKIYETLDLIKTGGFIKNEEVDDKKIAEWLKLILHGEFPSIDAKQIDKIKIYQKLQSLAYLLFGCEAARNPAMVIINQMLLDLIIEGDWSFADAFTSDDNCMPMAPEGAVAAARALEDEFRPFMPYPFFYRGPLENKDKDFKKNDLIVLEANVVANWLVLQTGKSLKSLKPLRPEWIDEQISACFNRWFGINDVIETQSVADRPRRLRHN